MKIYCYAISKNETKNVDAWVRSMKESDGIYVYDTGSTDDTVTKLRNQGVIVNEADENFGDFRFDKARNLSLDMVPEDADLCVCTDMDETFNPGWRMILEKQWKVAKEKNPEFLKYATYDYVLARDNNGAPTCKFDGFRTHVRKGVKWIYACHEIPEYEGRSDSVFIKDMVLDHHKDFSKPRSSYEKLLELDVKERPNEARPSHYLGREYMYRERWDDAIRELNRHLTIKEAWVGERAQSMRFIAKCYRAKGENDLAIAWYTKAIAECNFQRESAVELSQFALELGNGELGSLAAKLSLTVRHKNGSYLTEESSWGYLPYDYLSIGESMSKSGDFHVRARSVSRALELNPYDERIWRNCINCNGQPPVYPECQQSSEILHNHKVTDAKVDWSLFDKVYCIHYVKNVVREPAMKQEFGRVGLWGTDRFELVETVRTPYEEKFLTDGDANAGIRNLALNTLRTLLRSRAKGYKRILIFEDDVRFLKDVSLMAEIFADSPDSDIVVYDKMNFLFPPKYYELCRKNQINSHFASWTTGIYSGSCYSLNEKGMDACIAELNKKLAAPDDIIQVGNVTKAFSYLNVSCQQCNPDALYLERYGGYNMKSGYAFHGLDYSLYNVDEGYGYGKSFTDAEIVNPSIHK